MSIDLCSMSCTTACPPALAGQRSSSQLWQSLCSHVFRLLLLDDFHACTTGILKELQQSRQARMEEVHLTRSAWLAILGSRGHSLGSGTKKS